MCVCIINEGEAGALGPGLLLSRLFQACLL